MLLSYYRIFITSHGILTHYHPSFTPINRWSNALLKHTFSILLALFSLLYFLLLSWITFSITTSIFLLVMRSSGQSEKFLLYLGRLAQHTMDKYLRTVNLHASESAFLFLVCQFSNNLKDLKADDMDFGEKKFFFSGIHEFVYSLPTIKDEHNHVFAHFPILNIYECGGAGNFTQLFGKKSEFNLYFQRKRK